MRCVLGDIMAGRLPPEEVKEFLTTLARRGETAEEIASAVDTLRAHAIPLPLSQPYALTDTCGTGGDGQGTINVSTLAALVAAAAGVRIVKHGNRAASSRCGSADLLEALGVHLDASPAQVARSVEEVGFGFCFAPRFHPAMKAVAAVRKELGIRTLFNLVGPLANPAPLTYQLVGVSDAQLMRPMAEALIRLGVRRGAVVHGEDGLDEVTTTGPTRIYEVRGEMATPSLFDPASLGIPRSTVAQLQGGTVSDNAAMAREILRGTPSPKRDIIVVNAAWALYVAEQAPTVQEGLAKAQEALVSGQAAALLARVKEYSHAG